MLKLIIRLRHNATWKAIKPKVLELIDSLLVLIQITPDNYKLFSENPVLYMRRETGMAKIDIYLHNSFTNCLLDQILFLLFRMR